MGDLNLGKSVLLNNGVEMPFLGLGTYRIAPGEETRRAVTEALDAGYRHIDTATYYANERSVGEAIAGSGLDRGEIFVTTKVWNRDQGYEEARRAFDRSLKELGMDYADLYLIHWPFPSKFLETWEALEEIHDEGRVRAIGVSNFMTHHLEELLAGSDTVPAVNQVEFHPHLFNPGLLSYCQRKGIRLEAWSPLKRGGVLHIPRLVSIGRSYGRTPAQVALRWALQHGVAVIPKTVHRERMVENSRIFDFHLSEWEMRVIDGLGVKERVGPDPDDMSRYRS